MANNVFERYGLKEVSNVGIFATDDDKLLGVKKGDIVLYLDSLKVSTIEQTAEQTDATGGWGNPKLITWDYGKELTLTLEDALLSPESMRIMIGGAIHQPSADRKVKVHRTSSFITVATANTLNDVIYDSYGKRVVASKISAYSGINMTTGERFRVDAENPLEAEAGDKIRIFWDEEHADASKALEITISPSTFPGTYQFVGDTLIRNENTGIDEPYQWIVPKGKISSEVTFTMEAEGDPATFSFNVNVLRALDEDGQYIMMKWIKHVLEDEENEETEKD